MILRSGNIGKRKKRQLTFPYTQNKVGLIRSDEACIIEYILSAATPISVRSHPIANILNNIFINLRVIQALRQLHLRRYVMSKNITFSNAGKIAPKWLTIRETVKTTNKLTNRS